MFCELFVSKPGSESVPHQFCIFDGKTGENAGKMGKLDAEGLELSIFCMAKIESL